MPLLFQSLQLTVLIHSLSLTRSLSSSISSFSPQLTVLIYSLPIYLSPSHSPHPSPPHPPVDSGRRVASLRTDAPCRKVAWHPKQLILAYSAEGKDQRGDTVKLLY